MKTTTNNNPEQPQETPPEGAALTQLREENAQLKTSIRLAQAHRQITGELGRAGARSPELLFDSIKGELQFDDEGNAANAAALVEHLKTGFPEQFGFEKPSASIDAGTGGSIRPQLSRDALRRMKPSEIAELDWNDVRRVLAN